MRILRPLLVAILLVGATVTPVSAHGCHAVANSNLGGGYGSLGVVGGSGNILDRISARFTANNPANQHTNSQLHSFIEIAPNPGVSGRATFRVLIGPDSKPDFWQVEYVDRFGDQRYLNGGVLTGLQHTLQIYHTMLPIPNTFRVDFYLDGLNVGSWEQFNHWDPHRVFVGGYSNTGKNQFLGWENDRFIWDQIIYRRNGTWLMWPHSSGTTLSLGQSYMRFHNVGGMPGAPAWIGIGDNRCAL